LILKINKLLNKEEARKISSFLITNGSYKHPRWHKKRGVDNKSIMEKELIVAILFTVIGLVFIFNSKNIAKGAAKFYQKFYTEQNLGIMSGLWGLF